MPLSGHPHFAGENDTGLDTPRVRDAHTDKKTRSVLSLFLASALLIGTGAGCSDSNCLDRNKDGQCDERAGSSSTSSSYYGGSRGGSSTDTSGSSISQGSSAKGGIGSSGSSTS